jgi:hypothetical protein
MRKHGDPITPAQDFKCDYFTLFFIIWCILLILTFFMGIHCGKRICNEDHRQRKNEQELKEDKEKFDKAIRELFPSNKNKSPAGAKAKFKKPPIFFDHTVQSPAGFCINTLEAPVSVKQMSHMERCSPGACNTMNPIIKGRSNYNRELRQVREDKRIDGLLTGIDFPIPRTVAPHGINLNNREHSVICRSSRQYNIGEILTSRRPKDMFTTRDSQSKHKYPTPCRLFRIIKNLKKEQR